MALVFELKSLDPHAVQVLFFQLLRRHRHRCTEVIQSVIYLPLRHVEDRDHVSVGNEHEFGEVQDLGVQLEVACDTLVDRGAPVLRRKHLRRIETEPVPPKVWHVPNLNLQLALRVNSNFYLVRVADELEQELVKVRGNVDALEARIVILVD